MGGCCKIVSDLNPCQPWFSIVDGSGRIMDMQRAFSPQGLAVIVWKVFATGCCFATMIHAITEEENEKRYYYMFLSNWAVMFACLYTALSLLNTVNPVVVVAAEAEENHGEEKPENAAAAATTSEKNGNVVLKSARLRLTWIMFEYAAQMGLISTLLYYLLVYDGSVITYRKVGTHGVVVSITLLDGLLVNRIPVRLCHWLGALIPWQLPYVGWTILHDVATEIGNPGAHDNDPETNDDAVYGVLDWKEGWVGPAITSVITIFGLGAVFYMILWYMSSRCFSPPYLPAEDEKEAEGDAANSQKDSPPTTVKTVEGGNEAVLDTEEGAIDKIA